MKGLGALRGSGFKMGLECRVVGYRTRSKFRRAKVKHKTISLLVYCLHHGVGRYGLVQTAVQVLEGVLGRSYCEQNIGCILLDKCTRSNEHKALNPKP